MNVKINNKQRNMTSASVVALTLVVLVWALLTVFNHYEANLITAEKTA
ncbi:hypothetical protein BR63_01535 [Thermanaerosceptrum fracticalcis]|uniref:Uncharacterized protein n=1 Tax=Thermanaerosceptrum fracticalcis TaxID=1712410 RepID=A0A7G6DZ62_THEFR|nr:hypothetical protein [Thermanaerosceptrum fracticalcis]QNB45116.1 hypothetical protein BR63_01535 [Thermanaerosceptrum fracticalcis]